MTAAIFLILIAPIAALLAYMVRANAERLGVIALQNHRSSHHGSKATSGGLAIMVSILLFAIGLTFAGDRSIIYPVVIAAGLTLVGFADDRTGVPIIRRLAAQTLACALLAWSLYASFVTPDVTFLTIPMVVAVPILALLGALWINLFNFMDGIDGLAASQAIFVALVSLGFIFASGQGHSPMAYLIAAIILATLAFLIYNWAPSSLFLGDSGSYVLSFFLIMIALWGALSGSLPFAESLMLNTLFLVDSMVTLASRIIGRQKFLQAHSSHAYQILARRHGHQHVTLLTIAINVIMILPLVILVHIGVLPIAVVLLILYLPTTILVLTLRRRSADR